LHAWQLCFTASCLMNRDGVAAQKKKLHLFSSPMHTKQQATWALRAQPPVFVQGFRNNNWSWSILGSDSEITSS
jgi:hypothetical protein